jgi:aspartate 1-decarboxylase
MDLMFLKSKLHRATVTDADLNYEGSISIDPRLCEAAKLNKFERVEIYNCNNGERFATYVIHGKPGEICINGAAARLTQKGDLVIICSYSYMDQAKANEHQARIVLLGPGNEVTVCKDDPVLG